MDTSRFEERLRNERAALAETLDHVNALLSQRQLDESGELSMVDQHIADVATDTEFRELDMMQRRFVEDRIALIDDALERMRRGTYGTCVVCGEPIPLERLETLPWTPYCLRHATLESSPASAPPQRLRG